METKRRKKRKENMTGKDRRGKARLIRKSGREKWKAKYELRRMERKGKGKNGKGHGEGLGRMGRKKGKRKESKGKIKVHNWKVWGINARKGNRNKQKKGRRQKEREENRK